MGMQQTRGINVKLGNVDIIKQNYNLNLIFQTLLIKQKLLT